MASSSTNPFDEDDKQFLLQNSSPGVLLELQEHNLAHNLVQVKHTRNPMFTTNPFYETHTSSLRLLTQGEMDDIFQQGDAPLDLDAAEAACPEKAVKQRKPQNQKETAQAHWKIIRDAVKGPDAASADSKKTVMTLTDEDGVVAGVMVVASQRDTNRAPEEQDDEDLNLHDLAHRREVVRLVHTPVPPSLAQRIWRSLCRHDRIIGGLLRPRWDKQVVRIMVGDRVVWRWKGVSGLNIRGADRHFLPLAPGDRHFEVIGSSGPPKPDGTYEKQFHQPGTYYYCSASSASTEASAACGEAMCGVREMTGASLGGMILVQSEWQKARDDMTRKETTLVCLSLLAWLLVLVTLEVLLWTLSGKLQEMVASNGTSLTRLLVDLLPGVSLLDFTSTNVQKLREIVAGNGTPLNRLLADLLPDTLRAVTCFTSTKVQILTPEGLPGVLVWVIPPFSLGLVLVMTMLLLA
jgi:hypothetical protein